MKSISIFDIFKIGVGPSSSHTLGPWKAALAFIENMEIEDLDRVQVQLYGSLSKTGIGHATDQAIILGLMGYDPKSIDTNQISIIVENVKETNSIKIKSKLIPFIYAEDIIFEQLNHELHPNTLKLTAFSKVALIKEELFASVGGGFIESTSTVNKDEDTIKLPYPINNGVDLLSYTKSNFCDISEIVFKNESHLRTKEEIDEQIELLLDTMLDSIYDGCNTEGILPGGLNVVRRAKLLSNKLIGAGVYKTRDEWVELIKTTPKDFNSVNKWISCFALAVNEQNAAMGRIVTSPTNGAAGVIPAVLMYYYLFCDYKGKECVKKFLFTAGEIGCLFKKGATISAAVGGCQAEIGVSSSMAAAGLTEVLGGTPEQCLMAAEIAMEHHLGLTCDPIKGLVQVPCIERNAMGAIKAITASNLALESDSDKAIVPLDDVIKTMWEVSLNMSSKYKETSEGGLAMNLSVINPSC
jgi:L-serine dehydratase